MTADDPTHDPGADLDLHLVRPHDRSLVVPLPAAWELVPGPEAPVVLAAVEPDDGQGFRASVVVTVEDVPTGTSLQTWQREAQDVLAGALRDHLLIDTEVEQRDGRTWYRRLVHHVSDGDEPLTLQQWAVLREGADQGVTLSATVRTDHFVATAPVLSAVLAGFDPWSTS